MPDLVARGIRFNVMRMGEGEPTIVFVHGLLLDNHTSFYLTIAPALAKQASVLLYDLRGHGNSEQPPSGYATDDMTADLHGILDALGLCERRVIIVGHSFGGYVALRFAARYPQQVAGLVLLDAQSSVRAIGEQIAQSMALEGDARDHKIRQLFGNWLAKHAARGQVDLDDVDLDALDADGRSTAKFVGRLKQRRRRSPMVKTAERLRDETSFVRDIAAAAPIDDAMLLRIACPTLAIYGENSDLRAGGERLARLLPRCRLEIVPGCAHGILFHATAHVRGCLLAWIAKEGV